MPKPSEVLASLHTKVVDAVTGYEEGAEIAKRANVGDLCAELRGVHLAHAHEIAGLLLARGERAEADGSLMGVVHKAVLNVRFSITADEQSLLPGLRDGEKRILEAYDDTLRECEIADGAFTENEVSTLKTQRRVVLENVGKIDSMAVAPT